MKNFNILGVHGKIRVLGGGFTKNQYRGGGDCVKGKVWTVCQFKGGLARKKGMVLLRGEG